VSPQRTPSQTVGPFFAIGLPWERGPLAASSGGIRVGGVVRDGAGEPVPDALVETWQASPDADAGFRGFARCAADDAGGWEVATLKPAAIGGQAPHVDVSVFARGLLNRCITRIYFADEAEANAADPELANVPEERRDTLLAQPDGDGRYRFDVHLQGPAETVFFTL
jgi:protocatechuate 3,4-dioxygenase alpha subunit